MADIALDVQSAPTTPAAGVSVEYVDSTTKTLRSKDDAGTVHHYLDAASAGVTGVLKGNGTGPVTAIALPSDATKFLDGTGAFSTPSGGSTADNSVVDFRLTLTTAVPVTTTDVTGATTVYCSPYKGNRIALYDGVSAWNIRTSAEFSIALGTLTNNLPYDVFCYDNSGTPTLEILAWTSTSARATALVLQDGALVKSGATTRRYLGTFLTTATTTTEDSAANRYLWNYYNRVRRSLLRQEGTASWTYTTQTWRQANGATANQLNVIIGWAEPTLSLFIAVAFANTNASVGVGIGIGEDSTSSPLDTGIGGIARSYIADNAAYVHVTYSLARQPVVGKHSYNWLEISVATGTTTWLGNAGFTGQSHVSGMRGEIDS